VTIPAEKATIRHHRTGVALVGQSLRQRVPCDHQALVAVPKACSDDAYSSQGGDCAIGTSRGSGIKVACRDHQHEMRPPRRRSAASTRGCERLNRSCSLVSRDPSHPSASTHQEASRVAHPPRCSGSVFGNRRSSARLPVEPLVGSSAEETGPRPLTRELRPIYSVELELRTLSRLGLSDGQAARRTTSAVRRPCEPAHDDRSYPRPARLSLSRLSRPVLQGCAPRTDRRSADQDPR